MKNENTKGYFSIPQKPQSIIYIRDSSIHTMHIQAQLIDAFVDRFKLPVCGVFCDLNHIGHGPERVVFHGMLDFVSKHKGEIKYIIVLEMVRFCDNENERTFRQLELMDQGVTVLSVMKK